MGGKLAAVCLPHGAVDRGGPALVLQVLEIPVTYFTTTIRCLYLYLAHPSDATNRYA